MLGIKRFAGVAPEVNLWNPLHTGEKAPTTDLADATKSPKQGTSGSTKGLMSSKNIFNKNSPVTG